MVSGNNTSLFTASGAGANLLQGIPQESDLAVHQPKVDKGMRKSYLYVQGMSPLDNHYRTHQRSKHSL